MATKTKKESVNTSAATAQAKTPKAKAAETKSASMMQLEEQLKADGKGDIVENVQAQQEKAKKVVLTNPFLNAADFKEKRSILKEISEKVTEQAKVEKKYRTVQEGETETVREFTTNEYIRDYYKENHHTSSLHTFETWQKQGFMIRPSERKNYYLLWGNMTASQEELNKAEQEGRSPRLYRSVNFMWDIRQVYRPQVKA